MISRFHAARRDSTLAVLEGLHALKHAVRFGAEVLEVVVCERPPLELARRLAPDLLTTLQAAVIVDADTFASLAPHPPATGLMAIARRRTTAAAELLVGSLPGPIVYLESPAHLGNLGACVRVAAAAAAGGVLTSGPHDPWSPEAVRAAAGLHFALPVAHCDELPVCDRPLVAISPDGEPLEPDSMPVNALLAFGGERSGLSAATLDRADRRLAIPMRAGVSSLNLATAVAVILYAWRLGSDYARGPH